MSGGFDLDALWNFDDPPASEAAFQSAAEAARSAGDVPDFAEVLTQVARAQGLQRRFDDAHRTLDEAASLLRAADESARGRPGRASRARVRLLLERGRVFNSSGRKDEARPLFVEAWDAARAASFEALAVDAAHMVAIVETPDEAILWNERALEFAERASEPRARKWRGSLLNNLGWAYHERGTFPKALAAFEGALAAREEAGIAAQIRIAKWCVARCLRSLGRVEEALARQEELQRELDEAVAHDGFVQEELGECHLALGRMAEAQPYFARASEILSTDPWFVANEAPRLERMRALASSS